MNVKLVLIASDGCVDTTTVSTTIPFEAVDGEWPGGLVEAITTRAHEAAERLSDELGGRPTPPRTGPSAGSFVPLSSVVPSA